MGDRNYSRQFSLLSHNPGAKVLPFNEFTFSFAAARTFRGVVLGIPPNYFPISRVYYMSKEETTSKGAVIVGNDFINCLKSIAIFQNVKDDYVLPIREFNGRTLSISIAPWLFCSKGKLTVFVSV